MSRLSDHNSPPLGTLSDTKSSTMVNSPLNLSPKAIAASSSPLAALAADRLWSISRITQQMNDRRSPIHSPFMYRNHSSNPIHQNLHEAQIRGNIFSEVPCQEHRGSTIPRHLTLIWDVPFNSSHDNLVRTIFFRGSDAKLLLGIFFASFLAGSIAMLV